MPLLAAGQAAHAQSSAPPGAAGAPLRQQRILARANAPAAGTDAPAIGSAPSPGPPAAPAAAARHVTAVDFPPSHFLGAAELEAIAAPYIGRDLSPKEIDALVAAVNRLYDARGLVTARAVLPPQTTADGTLRIDLVEGRLGRLRITGNRYVRSAYLARQTRLDAGATIDPVALRAALWRFDRLSDVQLRAALAPGEAPGLTDVDIAVTEPRADSVTLFVDNHAYAATGTYEGGALYRHIGLIGLDDRLSALATASRGALTGAASYDAPLGYGGTRASLSYGRGVTRVIAGAYAGFGSKGLADSVTGEVSRPLWSDLRWLAVGSAAGGFTRTRNYLGGQFLGSTRTARGGLGLSLAYQGGGRAGSVALNGTYAHGEVENGAARRGYALLAGTVALTQAVAGPVSVSAEGAWQWSSVGGLPSDLLFQIGGPTTVRGYTQGALAGDKGYYAAGQLNLAMPKMLGGDGALFAFADHGRVTASFAQPHGLTSVGLGVTARLGSRLGLEASIGRPLRDRALGPDAVHGHLRLTWTPF